MYKEILYNLDKLIYQPSKLNYLLNEHELNCLSVFVKEKFNDSRTVEEIKNIICTELNYET